ncbi:MAG: glycosyltransferase family 2 protein [Clostridia bacterium]|nr:glycosyltransferase family 2 protein [Clostridia bacterium]
MLNLFYVIIFTELLTIFYNLIKFFVYKMKSYQNSKPSNSECNDSFHINILIPCYKEINIIKKTLEHFKILISNIENIDIYIITTEKEKFENTTIQTTYEYLLGLPIINEPHFHILNYPKTYGIMADQLNYGISEILKRQTLQTDRIYFSIYNADSQPDSSTFIELSQKIKENNFPKILQQYSNYFLNYKSQNYITRGFSIYQTAFEFRNGLINNNISNLLYSHVVGHGLTIRADYITSLDGFNSNYWCEDIYITGLIHNNMENILPLNSLDNAENPDSFKVQIIQNAVWFKTASHHLSILNDIKKHYKISMNGFVWLCHELRASIVWILMPIFLIYTFIYPIIIKNYIFLLLATCTYLFFIFTNYLLNLIIINKKRFFKYVKNYFSLCLAVLFSDIGPLYSFFLKEKVKTER